MPPAADQYLDDLSCYTGALHEDGYINGLCGKWHLGDSPNPQHGFSHWFALPTGGSRYNNAEMIQNGEVEIYTGYITDNAMNFIRQNAENPFYLSVNSNAPHSPFEGHPSELMDFLIIVLSKPVRKRLLTLGLLQTSRATWVIGNH